MLLIFRVTIKVALKNIAILNDKWFIQRIPKYIGEWKTTLEILINLFPKIHRLKQLKCIT